MKISDFGVTKEGKKARLYRIKNDSIECNVTDYGASLVSLIVLDRHGKFTDIVLGFDSVEGYEQDTTSIGCNVGRHANRIAAAEFTLEGVTYHLDKNDGENNLHSGYSRYSDRFWNVEEYTENKLTFSLVSPHLDQGFPGELQLFVTYELQDNELKITYHGTPDKDTIINLTNHSYFNLNGHNTGRAMEQFVQIYAEKFTPSDAQAIPYGTYEAVKGTPMDFTEFKKLSQDIESSYIQLEQGMGYDHNYCIDHYDGKVQPAVKAMSEDTGICMEIFTDYPGVQLYTANYLDGIHGKDGARYDRRDAVCFEPQFFPDAIHKETFPSPIQKAGEEYHKKIVYKFTAS